MSPFLIASLTILCRISSCVSLCGVLGINPSTKTMIGKPITIKNTNRYNLIRRTLRFKFTKNDKLSSSSSPSRNTFLRLFLSILLKCIKQTDDEDDDTTHNDDGDNEVTVVIVYAHAAAWPVKIYSYIR